MRWSPMKKMQFICFSNNAPSPFCFLLLFPHYMLYFCNMKFVVFNLCICVFLATKINLFSYKFLFLKVVSFLQFFIISFATLLIQSGPSSAVRLYFLRCHQRHHQQSQWGYTAPVDVSDEIKNKELNSIIGRKIAAETELRLLKSIGRGHTRQHKKHKTIQSRKNPRAKRKDNVSPSPSSMSFISYFLLVWTFRTLS